jgi:CheY-like chemotaxis protein
MSVSPEQLTQTLPYLRRYARALTGSTSGGDDLVAIVLRSVMENGGAAAAADDALTLYAMLNRAFDGREGKPEVEAGAHPIERALAGLPELQRRLFLLVNVEELAPLDAAVVLDLRPQQANDLLDAAQDAMRAALIANILIVEDDAIIAFDLAETVRGMGHQVCGTAATMDAALAAAQASQPSLALMDLRLAHGDSGITTAQALRRRSDLPIIFVTAFGDELTRRGLAHLGPVIQKPFTREQIERAITQAVFATPGGEGTLAAGEGSAKGAA